MDILSTIPSRTNTATSGESATLRPCRGSLQFSLSKSADQTLLCTLHLRLCNQLSSELHLNIVPIVNAARLACPTNNPNSFLSYPLCDHPNLLRGLSPSRSNSPCRATPAAPPPARAGCRASTAPRPTPPEQPHGRTAAGPAHSPPAHSATVQARASGSALMAALTHPVVGPVARPVSGD